MFDSLAAFATLAACIPRVKLSSAGLEVGMEWIMARL